MCHQHHHHHHQQAASSSSSSSPSSSQSQLSPPLHHLYRVLHKPFIFSCQPPILHHDQTRSFISGTKKRCVRDCALCETMIGGIVRKVWWQLEVKRAITRNPTTSLMTALSRVHCIRATAPPWALLGASFSLAISAAECTTADLAHLLVVWVQSGLLAPHQSPHKPPKCPTHPPLPYSDSSSPLYCFRDGSLRTQDKSINFLASEAGHEQTIFLCSREMS